MNGLVHVRMVVPKEQRAPGHDVIDELLSIFDPQVGTLAPGDKEGIGLDVFAGSDGAVDAAGDDFPGCLEECFGIGHVTSFFAILT
jgi:hypothetical protein